MNQSRRLLVPDKSKWITLFYRCFLYLGIVLKFPENPQLLSASKIGVHQTSISFSGPSKKPALSIVRIHAPMKVFYKVKASHSKETSQKKHMAVANSHVDPLPQYDFIVSAVVSLSQGSACSQPAVSQLITLLWSVGFRSWNLAGFC